LITCEPLSLKGDIDRLYAQMAKALAELRTTKKADKDPDHPLTKILRARQEIELLKVPATAELIEDAVAQGHHVVFAMNFRRSLDELAERIQLPVALIHGDVPPWERDHIESEFKRDTLPVVGVQISVGGVGLGFHDLRGEFPRATFCSPPQSAMDLRQWFGRAHRAGGMSKSIQRVLLASGSVEMKIHKALVNKLDNLDALTDGDLDPNNLALE